MEKDKTCYIYARQSGVGSDDGDDSVSIAAQIAHGKELAQKNGLQILGIASDENISGKTYPDCHEAKQWEASDMVFQKWLAESASKRQTCRQGLGEIFSRLNEIGYIVVEDLTRLYRPLADSALQPFVNARLRIAGVKILSVKEGLIDFADANDRLIQSLKNQINDEQIAIGRKKSMDSKTAMRRKGIWVDGLGCHGYKAAGKHKTVIVESEAEEVRYAFAEVLKGTPYAAIIRHINSKRKSGKMLSIGNLMRILHRPLYAGMMDNGTGTLIDLQVGQFEPLVSKADWYEVQKLTVPKIHTKERFYNYPLSGLVHCGYCGKSMIVATTNSWGTNNLVQHYNCPVTIGKGAGDNCTLATIRASKNLAEQVGKEKHLPEVSKTELGMRATKALVIYSADPDTFQNSIGLADALMPLCAVALIRHIQDANATSTIAEAKAEKEAQLAKNAEARKRLIALVAAGTIEMADATADLTKLKDADRVLQGEIAELQAKLGENSEEALHKIYAALYALKQGELPAGIYGNLIREVVKRIDVFGTFVRVVFTNGKKINLERVPYICQMAMPFPQTNIMPLTDGGWRVEIRYYYKSPYIKAMKYYAGEETIYDDGTVRIATVGKNPKPGETHNARGDALGKRTQRRLAAMGIDEAAK